MPKSLLDLAYDYVSLNPQQSKFQDIWAYCVQEKGFTEQQAAQKISNFYTSLMLDGRFVTLGENEWDLRSRHKFEKVHIDMSEVYSDVEISYDDIEEVEEEEEYNKPFKDKLDKANSLSDDEEDEEDDDEEDEEDEEEKDTDF